MTSDDRFRAWKEADALRATPPFIWPEARFHAVLAPYAEIPPSSALLDDADLISGLLVGVADGTVRWLQGLLRTEGERRICLVLVLFPAGPTREEHLRVIRELQPSFVNSGKALEVRVRPMSPHHDDDFKRAALPPTVIQAHNTRTGRTIMSIGSAGDAGHDPIVLGSLNFVFRPDDGLRDTWRRWFQYAFSNAAPLMVDTLQIPHLVPAKGDPEAARLWEAFELACRAVSPAADSASTVDAVTGEVMTDSAGLEVVAWDEGKTALDPLAQILQQAYSSGWLVTVDEATRIKPLTIPVKATLLGQQSERTVGALRQRQSFTLQVLDDEVNRAVEKCRNVTELMELLSYPLSQGNRWLPEGAKGLLEMEVESRNRQGQKALKNALGGNSILQFIAKRRDSIRKDLNDMYRQLGQGDAVPDHKLQTVLEEVERRVTQALDVRITPRAVYNRIGAPDLTAAAPDENWNQPLSLLARSAWVLRESLTDSYFPRRLSGLSFSQDDFRRACDVFGDVIVARQEVSRAKDELREVGEIRDAQKPSKDKCREVWRVIKGEQRATRG